MTTFGESHGAAMGAVVDGCPAGLYLNEEDINQELRRRRPGYSAYTSPRKEEDEVKILSGVFEGRTTGAPLMLLIENRDKDSFSYQSIRGIYRPGHANFTYLMKYGLMDERGGGRASARETVARVAAGAVAKKFLQEQGILCCAFLSQVGEIFFQEQKGVTVEMLQKKIYASAVFCPDEEASQRMMQEIEKAKIEGDSIGACVTCIAQVPAGLGDPVYDKLSARLGFAMLSIPAAKGFEMGRGFQSAGMRGSCYNDGFILNDQGQVSTKTNHAGGVLGGISTGMPLTIRVAFKPASGIRLEQESVNDKKEKVKLRMAPSGRHDPCVAIRAVPVVEAMMALTLADAVLLQRCATLKYPS